MDVDLQKQLDVHRKPLVSEQTRSHHFFLINLTFVATEVVNFHDMHVGVFLVGFFPTDLKGEETGFGPKNLSWSTGFVPAVGVNRFCSPG